MFQPSLSFINVFTSNIEISGTLILIALIVSFIMGLVAVMAFADKLSSGTINIRATVSSLCIVLFTFFLYSYAPVLYDGHLQKEIKPEIESRLSLDDVTLKPVDEDSKTEFVGSGTDSKGHKQYFTYTRYSDFGVVKLNPVTEGEKPTTAPTDEPTSQTN